MATTQLKDVVIPEEFTAYIAENTMAGHPLMQAGVIQRNPVIGAGLRGASDSFTIPYWLDLDGESEFEVVSDDPSQKIPTTGIGAKSLKVRKNFNAKAYSATALASELAGSSAIARIQERVGEYVSRQAERKLVSTLKGVYEANKAGTGDMINDVTLASSMMYQETAAIAVPDKCLNRKSLVDTISTMGMNQKDLTGLMVHRTIYNELVKLNQIKYVQPSEQNIGLATYMGLAITYSEDLPVNIATGTYTSVLFGRGAIAADFTEPTNAPGTEVVWDGKAANGGGESTLIVRQNSAFSVAGVSFIDVNVAGVSPTLAETEDKANYKFEYARKNIPLAFLTHISYEKAIEPASKAK